jgi:GxxExxY protein
MMEREFNRRDAEIAERRELSPEYAELTRKVIGCAIEVHKALGPGFLENAYEQALKIELGYRGLSFKCQCAYKLDYKGNPIGECRLDLVVEDKLVLELKAVDALHPIHTAQLLSYLKATRLPLGLLINFNVPVLKDGLRRLILTNSATSASLR